MAIPEWAQPLEAAVPSWAKPLSPAKENATEDLRAFALEEAQRQGVDPDLVSRVIDAESSWNKNAISPKGARGPMQLMAGTAKALGVNPNDPQDNIRGGIKYLKQNLAMFGGDANLALAAYNAGPGAVRRAGGIPNYPETIKYVKKITSDKERAVEVAKEPTTLRFGPWDTGVEIPGSLNAGLARAGGATLDAMSGIKGLLGQKEDPQELASREMANEALEEAYPIASTIGNLGANAGMMYTGGGLLGAGGKLATLRGAPSLGKALSGIGSTFISPQSMLEAGAGGGLYSALTSPENRAADTIAGAAGGAAGYGTGKFLGKVVSRITNPIQAKPTPAEMSLISKGKDIGIPLSAAQETGSKALKWMDSALDNLPYTAEKQAALKGAQRSIWQENVLKQLGEDALVASPDVLGGAYARMGKQFEDLSARNTVNLGTEFIDTIAKIDASKTPFSKGINTVVDDALELASKGQIQGTEYQQVRTSLTNASKGAMQQNPELGQALKALRVALDDAAGTSISAADRESWQLVRDQYKALKTVEKATDLTTGDISPAKLINELGRKNPQGMRYGYGDQTMPDLSKVGKQLIADSLPNSGTAQRSWYMNMLQNPTAGIGGALGLFTGGPAGAAVGMGLGAVTPLAAQKALWSASPYLRSGLLSPQALGQVKSFPGLLGYYGGVGAQ